MIGRWLREDGDGNGVEDIGDYGWWTEIRGDPVITDVLDLKRPSRCERTGKIGCRECNGGAGCNVLVQNLRRYGWSESNCHYELLGPAGTWTKIVGSPR